jgi:LysR family transcriptional regulator, low CO2-responsive transcriptional regulator
MRGVLCHAAGPTRISLSLNPGYGLCLGKRLMISASPRRLTVFKSVVDLGGFNLAAARLGIAQPSVGAHIKALEEQIGQPLFHRHRGSKPRLTKAGEAVYAFAIDVLQKSAETTQALASMRKAAAQEIVIGAQRDIATQFLPERLATFARKHPGVRMVTRIGTIEEMIELVRSRAVHLGLLLASGPIGGIRSEVLAHEPLTLVVSPQHPLAGRAAVSPSNIGRHPFVTGLRGSRYFELVQAALKSIGIERFEVAMELQESAAVKEVVRHGAGIACLPRCTVTAELAAGTLVALNLAVSPQELELRCGYRAPLVGAARRFVLAMKGRK